MTNSEHSADGKPQRKAYSYLRFSTPEQRKGDSYRRQTKMAQDYARQHGLDLDETLTFHDEGVSGYRGQNAEAGRLADFREAVEVGLVPQGSVLLVEQLDRLSRLVPRKAMRVLEDIVEAGVSVVTLNDGREYTPQSLDNDPTDLLVSVLTFMRANEESATKAKRLAQSWAAKRSEAATKPLTGIVPAWLRLNREEQRIEEVPERVAVVQRVFAMALQGIGQHKIAETFNREGLPTWGEGKKRGTEWRRSYIAKILTNDAVIGRLTPHLMEHDGRQKRRVPLEPLEGYYPQVISHETWADVQALLATKGAARGRQASAPVSNILARMAACPRCGKTMTRVQKGKRSAPTLVCAAAKAGLGCEYKSVRYAAVELALLLKLPSLIESRDGIEQVEGLEDRIGNLRDAIYACGEQIEEAVDLLLSARSTALVARLQELETQLPKMQQQLATLQDQRDVMAGPVIGSRIGKALGALQKANEGEPDRGEINRALRALFKRAVINWPQGTIELEWHLGGTCRVHYAWMGGVWPPKRADKVSSPD
ncbi:recombinase family protein [uncultured Sphingomonas sp.]|uniref:recombinase family protein n=1 Tax=uncultured Sphingomonas sp. TaxID=158754 RepID=UPI0025CE1BAA|nr:recombinase family protein [uncultured Sphingomonas sp.]